MAQYLWLLRAIKNSDDFLHKFGEAINGGTQLVLQRRRTRPRTMKVP